MAGELTAWSLALAQALLFVVAAPLLSGWVKRVKCHMQNRAAPAAWQPYLDLGKLLRKHMLLAENASWLFRAVPYIVFGATLLAAAVVPLIAVQLPTSAIADVIVLVAFFALARFFTALAGMDIGTAFGGMGASREMMVAALAEPAMLMAVFTLSMTAATTNLSTATEYVLQSGLVLRPSFLFAMLALGMVTVAESGRIPVDNPATHLELTMLHEAMILEYSGRHLALIEWASQVKLMIYAVLIVDFFFPWGIATDPGSATGLAIGAVTVTAKLMLLAVLLVAWETVLAKMRLFRVPQFLGFAFLLALLGMLTHVVLETGG
jgi:formate hydrogenlyase subunit 4